MDIEDGLETSLVETLEEVDLVVVGNPGFRPLKESGRTTALLQSAKEAVGLEEPVGDLFVYFGVR